MKWKSIYDSLFSKEESKVNINKAVERYYNAIDVSLNNRQTPLSDEEKVLLKKLLTDVAESEALSKTPDFREAMSIAGSVIATTLLESRELKR